jgi:hypothetical protein
MNIETLRTLAAQADLAFDESVASGDSHETAYYDGLSDAYHTVLDALERQS